MKAKVEITLTTNAQKKHLEIMRDAAEALTTDKKSIVIKKFAKNPKIITAEFAIKKAPQYKIVDKIGDRFTDEMEEENDSSISFSDD